MFLQRFVSMSSCACRGHRTCQGMSETNKTRFHLPDGQAQRARDAEMSRGATDWSWAAIAWLYEHDAEAVVDR